MEFGPVPVAEAVGAILAHSVSVGERVLRKGRVLTAAEVAVLRDAGMSEVTVARLAPGDLGENEAARHIAASLVPEPVAAGLRLSAPASGRVNIHATRPGITEIDAAAIAALNAADPAIALATLAPMARVVAGQMVATVKIISYAVPGAVVASAGRAARGALAVSAVVLHDASLILTQVPGQPRKLVEKGRGAVARRLAALGIELLESPVVAHETGALAAAIGAARGALILVLTGSATSDARDVGPAALAQAGGRLTCFGMPVDPGNLLFLGALGPRPVIGLPGCARSAALNGADWVLERVACGLEVSGADIAAMGVGGLLKESPARPHPREFRDPDAS